MKTHQQAAHEATQHAHHATTTAHQHQVTTPVPDVRPRRTVLVGRIIGGEWTTQGLHHFCEYCNRYKLGYDFHCPHCGKETL